MHYNTAKALASKTETGIIVKENKGNWNCIIFDDEPLEGNKKLLKGVEKLTEGFDLTTLVS